MNFEQINICKQPSQEDLNALEREEDFLPKTKAQLPEHNFRGRENSEQCHGFYACFLQTSGELGKISPCRMVLLLVGGNNKKKIWFCCLSK